MQINSNMRIILTTCILVLSFTVYCQDNKPQSLAFLKNYVGQTVTSTHLFSNTDFTARLKKVLGSRFSYFLSNWKDETPISHVEHDEILFQGSCNRINCTISFVIVYNYKNDALGVGIHIDGKQLETYWDKAKPQPAWIEEWVNSEGGDE